MVDWTVEFFDEVACPITEVVDDLLLFRNPSVVVGKTSIIVLDLLSRVADVFFLFSIVFVCNVELGLGNFVVMQGNTGKFDVVFEGKIGLCCDVELEP